MASENKKQKLSETSSREFQNWWTDEYGMINSGNKAKRTTTPPVRTKSKKTKTTAAALPGSVDTSAKDISHHSEYEATPIVSPRPVNLDNPPEDDAINALSLLATDTIADDFFISSDEDEDVIIVTPDIRSQYRLRTPEINPDDVYPEPDAQVWSFEEEEEEFTSNELGRLDLFLGLAPVFENYYLSSKTFKEDNNSRLLECHFVNIDAKKTKFLAIGMNVNCSFRIE
ncbi:hypothetical protein CBL_20417 [Carabus blaptoides fortunei]